MAVEARHLDLFPPRILGNRGMMMTNSVQGNGNVYGTSTGYGVLAPLSGTTTATETIVPMYGSMLAENIPTKAAAMKSDSGLTYAVPVSRKSSRDVINPMISSFPSGVENQSASNRRGSFTFLGEDFSFQLQQQQLEIDRFIAHHTEKVRMEVEERRKRYSRRIAAAVEESVMKKLKVKEEEIDKIGKLNWALAERAKSLCMETQIWRDMAQTNEATANALRCNLEQVLAQVQDEQQEQPQRLNGAVFMDDAQSCCGSNFNETDTRTMTDQSPSTVGHDRDHNNRMCRSCGKEESCVLLLPCRHLCLCTFCGSSLHTCPVCNSTKTASVHVNLSDT